MPSRDFFLLHLAYFPVRIIKGVNRGCGWCLENQIGETGGGGGGRSSPLMIKAVVYKSFKLHITASTDFASPLHDRKEMWWVIDQDKSCVEIDG